MSISWKDAASTILVASTATLAVAAAREWASFLTVRWAIAGMLVLGIGACAVGAYNVTHLSSTYSVIMGTLVAAVTVTAILGLIFGSKAYPLILAGLMGLLWIIATIRHAVIS